MSRLDVRCDVDVPVKISLDKHEEKARFSNLSLGGGLIECNKAYPEKGVISLEYNLSEHGKFEVLGEIVRVNGKAIAVRFCNSSKEEKLKLWNYLKEHLSGVDVCPYCRSNSINRETGCEVCGLSLDFDSPQYLIEHEKRSFLKRLAMKADFFSADDICRIHNFVDAEILGIGRLQGSSVSPDDLSTITSLKVAKGVIEKRKLIEALKTHNNNISKVAKVLEVSRPSVYSMIKKYGI